MGYGRFSAEIFCAPFPARQGGARGAASGRLASLSMRLINGSARYVPESTSEILSFNLCSVVRQYRSRFHHEAVARFWQENVGNSGSRRRGTSRWSSGADVIASEGEAIHPDARRGSRTGPSNTGSALRCRAIFRAREPPLTCFSPAQWPRPCVPTVRRRPTDCNRIGSKTRASGPCGAGENCSARFEVTPV